jgi:tetratricopeptide (TPR) repeat protein
VRWIGLLTLLALVSPSDAKPRPKGPSTSNFWRDIVEPHADEVKRLVENARQHMSFGDGAVSGEVEPARRLQAYHDAYSLMVYARKLSPQNLDVLAMLGITADEIGKTRQALDAFRAYLKITTDDKANAEVTGRLGAIYFRLGDLGTAIHYLRLAQAGAASAATLVHLSNALALQGEAAESIDVLTNALPSSAQYYTNDMTLVAFALAVAYDRDGRTSEAFEVLDRLKSQQVQGYVPQVQLVLAQMRFAPPEDRHYYQAFLYESFDAYVEARAEWATYAASGDLP